MASISVNKTPVTMLQELCVKNKFEAPYYESIGENADPTTDNAKTFMCRVQACQQVANGIGRSKKDAKHDAALQLLKLISYAGVDDDNMPPNVCQGNDAINDVLDICVQRNFPLAEFENTKSYGPSHAPEFEFECRIGTIVRKGVHRTKKEAKQVAAQNMLKTLQEMNFSNKEMQVVSMAEAMDLDDEDTDRSIRTYRELKKSDLKKKLGVTLADRHKFFQELDETCLSKARAIFYNDRETIPEKVNLMLKALGLKFEIKDNVEMRDGDRFMSFDLLTTEYDCYLIGAKYELYEEVYKYLMTMLNFT